MYVDGSERCRRHRGDRIGFGLNQSCRNSGTCICLGWVDVGVVGGGLFVEMAGPAICVLCSADTCTS